MAITSGQPTSCRLDYYELAHNDCLIGATTGLPGDFFGVTRRTHSRTGSPLTRTSENDRRKGRKGPPATFRRIGFTNDINHVDGRAGGRFAPLGVAETGGNWRKLPAETQREKLSAFSCLTFGVHPNGSTSPSPAEIAETPRLGRLPAGRKQ